MLLHRRSGHYSQAVTDIDRHMHWHATNAGSRLRKREEGRTQYQRLFTVATITAHPFPHRRTHPHSPTRQMHLPAKIRPERGRTLSQRYQWRTYVSKHARKHAHTHTHTSWCRVSHRWFSLFSFLAGSPVYLSSLSSGTQRWSRRAMEPPEGPRCPSSIEPGSSGCPEHK